MSGERQSVLLPRSRALVCLRPGAVLTDEETVALDEYFLALRPAMEKENARKEGDDHG